jgi:hypothetical protein
MGERMNVAAEFFAERIKPSRIAGAGDKTVTFFEDSFGKRTTETAGTAGDEPNL